jgi:hypothetical protein
MARLLVCALVALVAATAAGAQARDPRLERLALRPVDVELARSAVVTAADVGAGWKKVAAPARDDEAPDCPGQDFSPFTITGQAATRFEHQATSLMSRVEVYRTRAQALGDFGVSTRPGTAACEGKALRAALAHQLEDGRVTLVSAKQQRGPAVGERSIRFRIVLRVKTATTSFPVYVDLIGFLRDRAAGSVVALSPGTPAAGLAQLAARMDGRLRRVA